VGSCRDRVVNDLNYILFVKFQLVCVLNLEMFVNVKNPTKTHKLLFIIFQCLYF